MTPLEAFNPPPINAQTEHLFRAVHNALNDIDRELYPPVDTLHERYDEFVGAYESVGQRFASEAETSGLSDWLQYTIASRKFGFIGDGGNKLEAARLLFQQMERLGHPTIDPLISTRMIWANMLADAGELDEARAVGKRMLADVAAYRSRYSKELGVHGATFDQDVERFRKRLGI